MVHGLHRNPTHCFNVGRNLFGASLDKSFECLQTIFSELIIILSAVLLNQRHCLLYILSKPVSSLTTFKEIFIN